MRIVMNMSSYEIESDSREEEYSDEVMYAGWNPAAVLICQQQLVPDSKHPAMTADLAMMDTELFLRKMYACQR